MTEAATGSGVSDSCSVTESLSLMFDHVMGWRTRRAQGHTVVLGNSGEASRLALNYRQQAKRAQVVLIGRRSSEERLRLADQDVWTLTAITVKNFAQAIKGAAQIVVAGETEAESQEWVAHVERIVQPGEKPILITVIPVAQDAAGDDAFDCL